MADLNDALHAGFCDAADFGPQLALLRVQLVEFERQINTTRQLVERACRRLATGERPLDVAVWLDGALDRLPPITATGARAT